MLTVSLPSALDGKLVCVLNAAVSAPGAADPAVPSESLARLAKDYGKLPISFEVNQGQSERSVQFLARAAGYTLFLKPGEAVLSLPAPPPPAVKAAHGTVQPHVNLQQYAGQSTSVLPPSTVRLQLIGSNTNAEVTGVDVLPGKSNYLIGSDPGKWHTDVPTYAKVRYSDVYPGIDLVYYGNQEGRLEHDFVVAPGADPSAIAISLFGSDAVVPDQNGSLTLHSKTRDLTLSRPVAYQTIGGKRRTIPAAYLLAGSQIKFQLGSYDRNTSLVIDPVLLFTSVFGGTYLNDLANALTIDKARNIYVAGSTVSYDFPLVDPFQSNPGTLWISGTEAVPTVFVSKLNSTGTALLYSTYLGRPNSQANAIAVDNAGRIYLAGSTTGDFPVVNANQPTFGGGGWPDAFIAVLNPAGNALAWSTFMGGSGTDVAGSLVLDSSNNVYVAGVTDGGFPTLHSIDPPGSGGVWVAKFNSSGALQYSSVFAALGPLIYDPGGTSALAVDAHGSAYVTGSIRNLGYGLPPATLRGLSTDMPRNRW